MPARELTDGKVSLTVVAAVCGAFIGFGTHGAWPLQSGGISRLYYRDSPASMSIHQEATWSTIMPMSAVFCFLFAKRLQVTIAR